MSRHARRQRPPRDVGQHDVPWWKWAGVVPGRVGLGSQLSPGQRGRVRTGAFAAIVLFIAVFAAVTAVAWIATRLPDMYSTAVLAADTPAADIFFGSAFLAIGLVFVVFRRRMFEVQEA